MPSIDLFHLHVFSTSWRFPPRGDCGLVASHCRSWGSLGFRCWRSLSLFRGISRYKTGEGLRSFIPPMRFPSKNPPNHERSTITGIANLFAVSTTLRLIPLLVRTSQAALPLDEGLSFLGLISLSRLPTDFRSRFGRQRRSLGKPILTLTEIPSVFGPLSPAGYHNFRSVTGKCSDIAIKTPLRRFGYC